MIVLTSPGVPPGPSMGYGYLRFKVMRHLGWSAILLLCFLFMDTLSQSVRFQWVTGPWGQCHHSTCGYGGLQYRDVRCQMPSGQPVLPGNCEAALRPTDAQECYKPCKEYIESSSEKDTYYPTPSQPFRGENAPRKGEVILSQDRVGYSDGNVEWVVSQWSSCRLAPGVATCGRNNGVRSRNVTCERKDRRVLMDASLCARAERKPHSSEPCELYCRQDCIVTPFSAWSGCDATCHMTNRTRTRRIVVPPRHRGDHCPPFSEMQPCDNCSETYVYKLGEWGPCNLLGTTYSTQVKVHPIVGERKRDITCLQSKGIVTNFRSCADKVPDVLLTDRQACVIPQDCKVSTYSDLRPYNNSCIGPDGSVVPGFMIRTRQVLQLPMGEGLACPPNLVDLVQVHGEDPATLKKCTRAEWTLSSWSVCTNVPGYSNCGTGIQSRRAICMARGDDGVDRPVDESQCSQPKPMISQACQTDCNYDCSVSQWSEWSQCQNGDCSDVGKLRRKRAEGKAGKRSRKREILTLPGPGGKSCPHLSETQACEPEPCYQWRVTYGECLPNTRGGCGQGTRRRSAECVDKNGERTKVQLCLEDHGGGSHPMDSLPWEECYVPCPDDCVLSEWGEWSQCPDPCSPVAHAGPAVRVRTRRILAYTTPGMGTDSKAVPCPDRSALRETDLCSAPLECDVFMWKVSGWDRCTLIDTTLKCGRGRQRRQVDCYSSAGNRVMDNRCDENVRPETVQDCTVECPIDCRVTEWSEWSDCGTKCLAFTARQLLPKQRRQRFIMTYPQNGGMSCPHMLNEERQCLNLPVCETYYWEVSDWSDCVVPPIVPLCGEGLKARNVTCRHSNGTEYGVDVCLEKLSTMPSQVEHCYVPCRSDCQLSEWTAWGRCVQGCEGKRFRWRKLIGDSKTKPECRNLKKYPLDEQEDCHCDNFRPVVIGDWSDCILQPPQEGNGEKFAQMSLKSLQLRNTNETHGAGAPDQAYCGNGIKYMAISCQTSSRDMEGPGSCSATEYQEEPCTIPCPIDCKMEPWSEWSTCSVTCGSGTQMRYRGIERQPENGGRRCPQLYGNKKESQSRVCKSACQYHRWKADDWGPCLPHGGAACGPGSQTRTVGCYAVVHGSQRLMHADTSYCSYNERPPNVRDCDLRCPGECVMSDWTEWTPCKQPCNGQQTQTRSRSVLRYPGKFAVGSEDCASAQDVRVCIKGENCFEYSWELSDWTSCLINDGSSDCGVGHKERFALCRNDALQRVDDYKCLELFGEMTESPVVSCEIPCDNDCLLSDWSDWSICSQTCGLGTTTRYRKIVQAPVGNGRKCPDDLEQSRPCFKRGCYTWHVTEWSSCRTQQGVCGFGIQERNVSCVGEDGIAVNSSRCPHDTEKLVLKTRQPCRVPCPGECRLSTWSEWSKCYISCEDFQQGFTRGVRARSRAVLANPSPVNPPCAENLWEEEQCETTECTEFVWVASPWERSLRTVKCQRKSDGLVVDGGCNEADKPSEILTCDPSCTQPNAYCRDVNTCDCLGLYVAVRNNGTFLGCDMNRSSTTPSTTPAVEPASTTSIWMYAVIAVGTIFVISVAAALYNMCELFRTGPRPRRKNLANKAGGEDTRSGTRTPVATETTNAKNAEIEEMYKQCQPPLRATQGSNNATTPDYQNVDDEDLPPPPPPIAPIAKSEVDGRLPGNHVVPVSQRGARGDVEQGRTKHVGRSSMQLACNPEESEQLLPLAPLPASYACAPSPSASGVYRSASGLNRPLNRRYPACRQDGRSRFSRMRGVFGACLGGREDDNFQDYDDNFRDDFDNDLISSRTPCLAYVEGGDGEGSHTQNVRVELYSNVSRMTNHPNCMLRETELCSPRKSPSSKARDKREKGRDWGGMRTPESPTKGFRSPDSRGARTPESPKKGARSPDSSKYSSSGSAGLRPTDPRGHYFDSPTSNDKRYISSPSPSTVKDCTETFELDSVQSPRHPSVEMTLDYREDPKNRGSLSNISELSFDRPLSESSLKLGLTAESLQAAIAQIGKSEGVSKLDSSNVSDDTGTGLNSSGFRENPEDLLSTAEEEEEEGIGSSPRDMSPRDTPYAGSVHYPGGVHYAEEPRPGYAPFTGDPLYTDPRILRLSRPHKDGSLDSGHCTLPPSRNGSVETPVDSWSSVGHRRQQQQQQQSQQQHHHQDPATTLGTLSPTRDASASLVGESVPTGSLDPNLAFRQSLDSARARKNIYANAPGLGTGSLPHSPNRASLGSPKTQSLGRGSTLSSPNTPFLGTGSLPHSPNTASSIGTASTSHSPYASRPSSVASSISSPSGRQRVKGVKVPSGSGASSPGGRSVCDACQKVIGYASDTQDSLSHMSDRSQMETTV